MARLVISISFTIAAIIAIVLFLSLKGNRPFISRAGAYWQDFLLQKDATVSSEQVRALVYDGPYEIAQSLKEYMDRNKIRDAVLLLEPNDYLQEKEKMTFRLPEPIVFYNFSGIKTLWMNSKNVADATHMLYIQGTDLKVVPIADKAQLQAILNKYKSYTPSL